MQRIFSFLLLLFLPVAALADGMMVPTIAYPAKITIPDQRALICLSNGTERLVIETRFTGSGTNFAWVVPLPSQPVIEEATTGLFPTLQYLFRPEIVHDVARYYSGVLALIGIGYLLLIVRPSEQLKWPDALACVCVGIAAATASHREVFNPGAFCVVTVFLFCLVVLIRIAKRSALAVFGLTFLVFVVLAGLLLPALATASKGISPSASAEKISILDRNIVGIFETTTIASPDAKALQTWLLENGYSVPTNAEPVIASYVKDGWVFVATKVRRDRPDGETSTPHPLSFTFKTDKPVYPMRLTGVDNGPLMVDLYVFSDARASAPHFKVESCTQPKIAHPLLHQWTDGSPVATKLTATLSPSDMRNDVWLKQAPFVFEQRNRLFSRQGALTTALNWGAGLFAAGLVMVCLLAFASEAHKTRLLRRIGIVVVTSIILAGVFYLSLSKIEVKLTRGYFPSEMKMEPLALLLAFGDSDWHTTAEVRAGFQEMISNPTNAALYGVKNWDNYFVGGQLREEDSPGNYLLRETNNQLQFITFNFDGGENIYETLDLHTRR